MSIRDEHDWILPAALIGAVLLAVVAFAIGFAVGSRSDDSGSSDSEVADDLATYTECLRDNGADVPLVESGNGELSVTFFEGDIDPEVLGDAMAACEDLAPGLVRGLLELHSLEDFEPFHERRRPGFRFDPDVERRFEPRLEELCELLDEGLIPPDRPIYDRLIEACAEG